MKRSLVHYRLMFVALLVCIVVTGCKVGYPYYTLGGNSESRVVTIHLGEAEIVKLVLSGADIQGQTYQLTEGGGALVEKGKASVYISYKGPFAIAEKVIYDGKEIKFHEPVL